MPNLPGASTRVDDTAGAYAGGTDLVTILAPVPAVADIVPRVFGNAAAIYDKHGYSEGLEYTALHFQRTGKSVNFVGLPIDVPGVVGREDTTGNTGTSVSTVAVGPSGSLTDHDAVVRVIRGGTVGTSQILLGVSLDGGFSEKPVRLGTATSYTIPFVGVSLSFTVGTLVVGDVIHTWHGTGPIASSASIAAARTALAAQTRQFRDIMLIGDCPTAALAEAFRDELNAYETENERYVYGRCSVRDRASYASLSALTRNMSGTPQLTFSDVGATGDTIVRSAGSWLADGFLLGDHITVAGTVSNNGSYVIDAINATTITLDAETLTDETLTGATVTGAPGLSFASSTKQIGRNTGSWIADGFAVGDSLTITGTVSNNGTFTVDSLSAGVIVTTEALTDEAVSSSGVTITAGELKADWMASIEAEFASISTDERIDLAAGRGRVRSPWGDTWQFRRPASWAASLREFVHDLQIPVWRKEDGPTGFDLYDLENVLVEWDDKVDGGAGSLARFTTFRSWNRPVGAFIALSLTRAPEGSLLGLTHNVAVTNLIQTIVQLTTENAIGRSLRLNPDGTGTDEALSQIESEVNNALELGVLIDAQGEGQRASRAVCSLSREDVLNVPEATINTTTEVVLNGTVHTINNTVRVITGGQ